MKILYEEIFSDTKKIRNYKLRPGVQMHNYFVKSKVIFFSLG